MLSEHKVNTINVSFLRNNDSNEKIIVTSSGNLSDENSKLNLAFECDYLVGCIHWTLDRLEALALSSHLSAGQESLSKHPKVTFKEIKIFANGDDGDHLIIRRETDGEPYCEGIALLSCNFEHELFGFMLYSDQLSELIKTLNTFYYLGNKKTQLAKEALSNHLGFSIESEEYKNIVFLDSKSEIFRFRIRSQVYVVADINCDIPSESNVYVKGETFSVSRKQMVRVKSIRGLCSGELTPLVGRILEFSGNAYNGFYLINGEKRSSTMLFNYEKINM